MIKIFTINKFSEKPGDQWLAQFVHRTEIEWKLEIVNVDSLLIGIEMFIRISHICWKTTNLSNKINCNLMKFKGGRNPTTHSTLMDPPMKHKVYTKKYLKFRGGGPDFHPPPAGSVYSVWIDRKLRSHPSTM